MTKFLLSCLVVLCMALSGCAGNQREPEKIEPPEQKDTQEEVQKELSPAPSQAGKTEPPAEPDPAPEDDGFSGRWQAVEDSECYMDIAKEEDSYTLEIVKAGDSQGNTVWQAAGSYDEIWGGVAYTGAKYEEVVKDDGTVDRVPVPEREEVTGMVYLEEDGTLHWVDDFDHAGDDISFERE